MFQECLSIFMTIMALITSKGSIKAAETSITERVGTRVNLSDQDVLKEGKEKSLKS